MHDAYPDVNDELKAHALSLSIGRYLTCAPLIQRMGLGDWLAVLAVFIDYEIQKIVHRYGEELPSPVIEMEWGPSTLASQLIARWKQDRALQARFPQFVDYVDAVESMLEGRRPMDAAVMPELKL
jgi:hypothetical protein